MWQKAYSTKAHTGSFIGKNVLLYLYEENRREIIENVVLEPQNIYGICYAALAPHQKYLFYSKMVCLKIM